ncbi:MAG: hypothetical protein II368_01875 [Clostridia bacterium]|nr:hypothetical protein [Clostridia bacterium]MBQ1942383.1 hypothetical protein [Clostridia bacterium]MBQ5802493.1 hypothetical protein [Clostridia bacterium]
MKEFTRMMLAAYPRIPHLVGTMSEIISQTALKSFYDRADCAATAVRLLRKIEKRDTLVFLGETMRRGVESLPETEKRILSERYFGEAKYFRKEGYAFSKSTYYRRLRRAVRRLERFLENEGAEERFYRTGLHKTAFFSFLADHLAMRRRKKLREETSTAAEVLPALFQTPNYAAQGGN